MYPVGIDPEATNLKNQPPGGIYCLLEGELENTWAGIKDKTHIKQGTSVFVLVEYIRDLWPDHCNSLGKKRLNLYCKIYIKPPKHTEKQILVSFCSTTQLQQFTLFLVRPQLQLINNLMKLQNVIFHTFTVHVSLVALFPTPSSLLCNIIS